MVITVDQGFNLLVQLVCKEVKNRNWGKNVTQRALGEQALAVQEVDSAIQRKKTLSRG